MTYAVNVSCPVVGIGENLFIETPPLDTTEEVEDEPLQFVTPVKE
ncbi:hypothetical protein TcasGA2_TC000009 [Tribolium castaneum]|uniref:Uncharacterized protein n=1 Tax=Tribolium castaneum TaxID=7070 RepID=D7EKQ5_TRICA|nr:hypothetical protein TcasGA2_TC000009 [Tribolium castaneum]